MADQNITTKVVGIVFIEGQKWPDAFAEVLEVDVGHGATVYTLGTKVYRPDGIEGRAFDVAVSVYKMVTEWLNKVHTDG